MENENIQGQSAYEWLMAPTTPLSSNDSKKCKRLAHNCKLVQKLLKRSEGIPMSTIKRGKDNTFRNPHVQDDDRSDDSAFAYYDRMLASSNQNQCLLQMQWNRLLERLEKEEPETNSFMLSSVHVGGVLLMSRKLNVNYIVRFRALELYNRFLLEFARKHESFFRDNKPSDAQEFKRRFESQVFLRLSTCILIASKLHADTQTRALTTEGVKYLLDVEGFQFTRSNVARSEMRIMEMLTFKCLFVTPLELVEQLLSILSLKLEYLRRAHHFCVLLLEYSYTDMAVLRDKFRTAITKSQRFTVSNGKVSMLLLSASIVAAGLFIVSTEMKTHHHKVVAKTVNLNEEDVHILAVILLDSLNVC